MEGDVTGLGTGGTQNPQHKLSRKRRAQGEESSKPISKRPRLRGKRQPFRRSPRLQEIRDANQQRAEHIGKPARPSHHIGTELLEPSLTIPKAPKNFKRHRNIEDQAYHKAKRSKRDNVGESKLGINQGKYEFIKAWLSDEKPLRKLDSVQADDMPLPPSNSSDASIARTSSGKSDKSSVTPYDSKFRESLGHHNIYINLEKPPAEAIWRASGIVTGPRLTPEVDEATAEEIKDESRQLETEDEEDIIQQLAIPVISAMIKLPDQKLISKAGHQWTNFVPVPLDLSVLMRPIPLSRPKPDKIFGYSKKAFTRSQLATIDLLTDTDGRSYAMPDKGLYFPFIDIEFKALAKGGSHIIATNQAANVGSVAGHGLVELARRGSGLETLDCNEPHFFSISMDHTSVYVNVHWLNVGTEDEQSMFHVEMLSLHNLRDLDGLRAVQKTVKNILDWGRGERLQMICKQLDAYNEKVQVERVAAAASESVSVDTEVPKRQKQKRRKPKK
ncbi:MAG: hypothetical protein M1813_001795 [Trichoglossum hirsutum]|nr:MAG: hypothetical protein M1813_001795 [Trichoglossum hirsutum]